MVEFGGVEITYFEVHAFVGEGLRGNPAGVCPQEAWLPDDVMQRIAADNNLSETAFLVGRRLRWFTPTCEVDLCGHATLATAHVLARPEVEFETRSGVLKVRREGEFLAMDFPAREEEMRVLGTEAEVRALSPIGGERNVIVTAPGTKSDFVSRYFAPASGVPEDPATGSAHCTLTPYWAKRLGKKKLHGIQVSARGGEFFCEDRGSRVIIAGRAITYLRGTIQSGNF